MPNPVDDAPVKPGEIALPSASDSSDQPNGGAGLRKFRRRVFYVVAVCCTLTLLAFWEHPPAAGRPIDDLAHKPLVTSSIADDPRLEVRIA
jgi:hypothetical protein